ncbi:MAG: glycerol-3-phosphate 1-O-acyltransferase PlsY [Paracoccaceae bacterium]
MTYLIVALASYLLGSIPFGLVIARLFGLGDIRKIGSGNIGATNVLRTGNKLAAFLTVILDAGKGAIAVLVARAIVGEDAAGLAGLFAMLGHLYPVYLKFKGGKGFATFLGTLLALSWPVGLATCATWAVVAAATRYSSLAALVAAALAPIFTFYFYHTHGAILILLLSALIFYRHGANIQRLIKGTEPKIKEKADKTGI